MHVVGRWLLGGCSALAFQCWLLARCLLLVARVLVPVLRQGRLPLQSVLPTFWSMVCVRLWLRADARRCWLLPLLSVFVTVAVVVVVLLLVVVVGVFVVGVPCHCSHCPVILLQAAMFLIRPQRLIPGHHTKGTYD